MEFEVGDKVRIKKFDERPWHWDVLGKMDKWMGQVMTIACVHDDNYYMKEDSGEWAWLKKDFKTNGGRAERGELW